MAFQNLLLLFAVSTAVHAANDWSKPCFEGTCEYDLPAAAGSASGTVKIFGSVNSIADITTAGGWEIIGCDPSTLTQDIRLVCKEGSEADCDRLYGDAGASGKVVRLPENCGSSPFSLVTDAWVPEDQSIPSNLLPRLMRRDGTVPEVKALSLTSEFDKGPSRKGAASVGFAIRAANVPGAEGELDVTPLQRRSNGRYEDRGFFDFVKKAIDAIKKLNTFDVEKSGNVLNVGVDKNFNLIDESLDCPPVAASIKVDVGASATAAVALGVAVSGTIIPPLIDDFAIISTLNADLQGNLTVNAGVTGTLDSGKILLFEAAIPGLNFPGILTIGPSFQLNAQAKASLDLNLGMTVGISYKIDKAELVFPPNSERASNGTFTVRDTPLKLSASPNIAATGTLEAHLIPGINLGISALGGVVGAGVFLDIDGQAFMKLSLEASANGEVVVKPAKQKQEKVMMRGITSPGHHYWNRAAALDSSDIAVRSPEPAPAPEAAELAARQTNISTSASASFGGCFEIGAGLDVNVGANADFFGLFNPETSISLFSQRFELFKRCFGDSVSTKREVPSLPYHRRSFSRFGARAPRSVTPVPVFKRGVLDLLCPANLPAAVSVTEDTITAAEIKKV